MTPSPLMGLLLAALASTTSAIPLLTRADSCPAGGGDVTCPTGLPGDFCCPTGSSCLSLAGDTTALCCPSGSTCNKIETIACNVALQDVSTFPDAVLKTTALDIDLPKCGSNNCCPFGYSCNNNEYCVKDDDQSKKPSASASGTPTVSHSVTATSNSASITTAAPAETTAADAAGSSLETSGDTKSGGSSGAGTAVAVVLVIVALGVIAVLVYFWYRRRKRAQEEEENEGGYGEKGGDDDDDDNSGSSTIGRQISKPVSANGEPVRNDFLSQRVGGGGPDSQRLPGTREERITTLFTRDSAMTDANGVPMAGGTRPPPRGLARNGDQEDEDDDEDDDDDDDDDGDDDDDDDERGGPDTRVNPYRPYGDPNAPRQQPGSDNRYNGGRPDSGESISVFADPNTMPAANNNNSNRRQTDAQSEFDPYDRRFTNANSMFGEMLNEAGLNDPRKGGTYVPPMPGPGRNLMR